MSRVEEAREKDHNTFAGLGVSDALRRCVFAETQRMFRGQMSAERGKIG